MVAAREGHATKLGAVATIGVVLLGVLAQAWPGLWRAQLLYDDAELFARSFQYFSPADWVEPYMGYRSLLTSILASVLCTLPAGWIPHAFVLAAVAVAARTACELLGPRWSVVAPWRARAIAAVALAWLPLGNFALSTCLSFAQWHALFWLGLVLLRPPLESRSGVRCVGETVLVALLVWSNPMSVALLPVALLLLWRPQRRVVATTFFVAATGYVASVNVAAESWHSLVAAVAFVPLVLERVLFESWFGTGTSRWFSDRGLGWMSTLGGLAVLLVGVRLLCASWGGGQWRRDTKWLVGGSLLGAACVVAACLLVRGSAIERAGWWGHRYLSFGRWAWVMTTSLVLATRLPQRWGLVLLVVWGLAIWWGNHDFYRLQRPSPELRPFLQRLESEERRLGDRRLVEAHLVRGEWSIHITPK